MIASPSLEHIQHAADLIRAGDLVAFPTETVYGLGADATNRTAVEKIYALKGRPVHNPLIVHIASIEHIWPLISKECAPIVKLRIDKLKWFWPGPLSLVVPKSELIPDEVTGGKATVAIRIPKHPVALSFLQECGCPVAAPSANRSNYVSPTTAKHVHDEFVASEEPFILDGGPCKVGIESTVASISGQNVTILRLGAVTQQQLEEALGEKVIFDLNCNMISPGTLPVHYSPKTRLVLRGAINESEYPTNVGLISFSNKPANDDKVYRRSLYLSDSGTLEEVAQGLYAALRELDSAQLDLIVIDRCSHEGLGAAIMDRIIRASNQV